MSLLAASPGHDAVAFARGRAVVNGSSPGGLIDVQGLPAGWRCSVASTAADASVETDLVVIVSGSPRIAGSCNDVSVTRPVTAREIGAAWRSGGPSSLAALSADFALVVIEPASGRVHGCVDPFGLNSLFCASQAGRVVGTESLAVAAALGEVAVDPASLQDVFNLRFLSGRGALWQGVRQVLPGTLLTLDGSGEPLESEIRRIRFRPCQESPTMSSAADLVRQMLEAAFARRRDEGMDHVAVPLSGGVDSSILAALAARTFPHATAFTASMDGFENPESDRARDVAARLGMRYRSVRVSDADVSRLYAPVMARLQEPARHFNNIAIARLADAMSEDCAWVVSGDTSDLLFGGGDLNTVRQYDRKRRAFYMLPRALQQAAAGMLRRLPGRRSASLARIAASTFDELIQSFDAIPRSPQASACLPGLGTDRRPSADLVAAHYEQGHAPYEAFQTWHLRTFLTSIYRRNERLSRAQGLRYWYPMKEPDIVEYATRMPSALKFDARRSLSKPILRLLCDQLVGPGVSGWSKLGFPSPEREWMTGPLAANLQACKAEDALISSRIELGDVRKIDIQRDHQMLWTLMTLETALEQARAATSGH